MLRKLKITSVSFVFLLVKANGLDNNKENSDNGSTSIPDGKLTNHMQPYSESYMPGNDIEGNISIT